MVTAPGNRRPGHSRRAQYGTFFGYLIALGGAGIGAGLLFVSTNDSAAFAGVRTAAVDSVGAASKVTAAGRTESQGLLAVISGYITRGSRVAALEREVRESRVLLAEQAALKEENARLRATLGLTQGEVKPVTTARLLGSTSSSTRRFATLGAGAKQGVQPGMVVRSPLGVVGRVLEVGNSTSRVLLITDNESTIPVRRADDGVQAYATGRGDGTLQLKLAVSGLNPFKKGDAIVTSGSGGLFRPGEAVAVVVSLTPDGAVARPLSDPGMTEFVVVEPIYDEALVKAATSQQGSN